MKLLFDQTKWQMLEPQPVKSLQFFVTNRCNKRCAGCFYDKMLGKDDMSIDDYKGLIDEYTQKCPDFGKVILLGGEPTIHKQLKDMVVYNQEKKLKTTIYTNGFDLDVLHAIDLENVSVRIGVLGLTKGEKNLKEIKKTDIPVGIVYMLRKDNIDELMDAVKYSESNFNCKYFMISSIRDIEKTGSFRKDTADTVSNEEYFDIVQDFITVYDGKLDIHISRRGVIEGAGKVKKCRFLNVYPDKKMTICPFDISLDVREDFSSFDRDCQKGGDCLLQKVILVNKKM